MRLEQRLGRLELPQTVVAQDRQFERRVAQGPGPPGGVLQQAEGFRVGAADISAAGGLQQTDETRVLTHGWPPDGVTAGPGDGAGCFGAAASGSSSSPNRARDTP